MNLSWFDLGKYYTACDPLNWMQLLLSAVTITLAKIGHACVMGPAQHMWRWDELSLVRQKLCRPIFTSISNQSTGSKTKQHIIRGQIFKQSAVHFNSGHGLQTSDTGQSAGDIPVGKGHSRVASKQSPKELWSDRKPHYPARLMLSRNTHRNITDFRRDTLLAVSQL